MRERMQRARPAVLVSTSACLHAWAVACSSAGVVDPALVAPEQSVQPVATALPPLQDAGLTPAREAVAVLPWSKQPEEAASLMMGLAGLTGMSHGVIVAILPLVLRGIPVPTPLDVLDARVTGEGEVDGVACDRVKRTRKFNGGIVGPHIQLWSGRTDSLIRRVVEDNVDTEANRAARQKAIEQDLPHLEARFRDAGHSDADIAAMLAPLHEHIPVSTYSTATYHPRCNQPVAPEALRAKDTV